MIKYSAQLSCLIAGISLKVLNDSIYLKRLKCVPETQKGKARTFDENELLMLMVYGVLTRNGLTYARAGEMACEFLKKLRIHKDKCAYVRMYFTKAVPVVIVVFADGSHEHEPERDQSNSFIDTSIDVGYMRRLIIKSTEDGKTPIVYGGG